MQDTNAFSSETRRRMDQWTFERRLSDKFTDEEIDRMLRNAAIKVGKFVMPTAEAEREES